MQGRVVEYQNTLLICVKYFKLGIKEQTFAKILKCDSYYDILIKNKMAINNGGNVCQKMKII